MVKVGDKMLCIRAKPPNSNWASKGYNVGQIYTITYVFENGPLCAFRWDQDPDPTREHQGHIDECFIIITNLDTAKVLYG